MQHFSSDQLLVTAFARAQMAGRALPQLCDFPSSISKEDVERRYLKPLQQLHVAYSVSPLQYTTFGEECGEDTLLTCTGDAWAAMIPLESYIASPAFCLPET